MRTEDRIRVLRESGAIMRCHNVPHHGEYSVGLHSYNVVSLILQLHPNPRMELIRAAMWHDMPERYLGDLPAPAKWYNPNLRATYEHAEATVLEKVGMPDLMECLTDEEIWWLHACDRLELELFCQDQAAMGNRHTNVMHLNVLQWFMDKEGLIPQPVMEAREKLRHFERTSEDIR